MTVHIGEVAPWHYNGPTNISADYYRNGKGYQLIKNSFDPSDFENSDVVWSEREVTQQIKNADMNIIPHPFASADPATQAVVLVDPVSNIIQKAHGAFKDDFSELSALFQSGVYTVDNTPLERITPPGVIVCAARKK